MRRARDMFWRATPGVAAMEFAIIAPVMIVLVLGVFDVAKGVILWQEVVNAARNIPVSASSISVQSDKTTVLSPAQTQETMSTIYAEMPWLRDGIETNVNKSVTLSSVAFVPIANCTPGAATNCFQAYIAWSAAYKGGAGQSGNPFQSVIRPCGIQQQKNPTDSISAAQFMLALRTLGVTEPDPILVADVHYQYSPFFTKFVTGPLDFRATGYWSVRSVNPAIPASQQYTQYVPIDLAVNCAPPPLTY